MRMRTLPPVAAPSTLLDLWSGAAGLLQPQAALDRLAREMSDVFGVNHVYLVSSGRAALTLILRAIQRLSPRRRVIVPGYTCFSVPAVVVRAGLDLVACDIDSATLDFDYGHLETLLSESPALCVVPTHMFGLPADTMRVRAMCEARGVFVVEDAAQAFGIVADNRWSGTSGDVGFYSFARGKTVSAGAGGAVVTSSASIGGAMAQEYSTLPRPKTIRAVVSLAEAAATSIFVRPRLYWLPARLPFLGLGETRYSTAFNVGRLSGVQAGLLRRWRRRVASTNEARAARLERLGQAAGRLAPPGGRPCLRLPFVCRSREERDRLCARGDRDGLGLSQMYPSAINGIPELRGILGDVRLPHAEDLAQRLLTVPIHPLVSVSDVEALRAVLETVQEPGEA